MAEKPFSYNYEPPPGIPARSGNFIEHKVTVHDARPVNDALSLDCEGFVLVHYQTAAADLYDEAIITSVYYPECERLMREATGARRVVAFDHIVRNSARAAVKGSGIKMPAGRVHNDYTDWSAPQRVRDLMGDEADELLRHRFAIVNLWRPIKGPLLDAPLALCHAGTIADGDLVAQDLIYRDRTGEIYALFHNEAHRWFYAPVMIRDEVLLLKCFDSMHDGRARFMPHTSFDDPTAPVEKPPRESIELRTLVFFPDH
jgi:hypothetical protein